MPVEKDQTELISIGIPVYNGERFIREALDCVLSQTYKNIEVVVCDNASTDQTVSIVESYIKQDSRIKLFQNEINCGAAKNFARTLDEASGVFFKWMASDDVIAPTFLEVAKTLLDSDPDIMLVYSQAAMIDENSQLLYNADEVIDVSNWSTDSKERFKQMVEAVMEHGSIAAITIFGLARTEFLRSVPPIGNYFGSDIVFMSDVALRGQIAQLPEIMTYLRRHEQASSEKWEGSAASNQQNFFDPSINNPIIQELQLRRRFFEIFKSIYISELSIGEKLSASGDAVQAIMNRAGKRFQAT